MSPDVNQKFRIHLILTAIFALLVHITYTLLRADQLTGGLEEYSFFPRMLSTILIGGGQLQNDGVLVLFLFITTLLTSFLSLSYKISRALLALFLLFLVYSLYSLVNNCFFGGLFCIQKELGDHAVLAYLWISGIVAVPNLMVGANPEHKDRAKAFWIVCFFAILTMWGTWILLA